MDHWRAAAGVLFRTSRKTNKLLEYQGVLGGK